MPRQSGIWFRKHDGWWYTTFQGVKTKLSKDEAEAKKAYHTLHAAAEPKEEGYRPTFRKLANAYLDYTQQTKSERTYTHQKYFLKLFCAHVGKKIAAELKPLDVTAWILKHKETWGHNTQVTARGLVVSCLNWSIEQGYLPYSPLAKMKVGQMHSRERILTKEERALVLANATGKTFKLFLRFLEQTGARPYSEAAQITADMIDWEGGCIPLLKHKNARKGKKRVIYLSREAKEILKELCELRPDGILFRTRFDEPYNRGNIIKAFRRLEIKLGIKRFNPYAYRHSYICDALERGLTADVIAELVGNTPKTIAKYYSHLEQKKDLLRDSAQKAVGG